MGWRDLAVMAEDSISAEIRRKRRGSGRTGAEERRRAGVGRGRAALLLLALLACGCRALAPVGERPEDTPSPVAPGTQTGARWWTDFQSDQAREDQERIKLAVVIIDLRSLKDARFGSVALSLRLAEAADESLTPSFRPIVRRLSRGLAVDTVAGETVLRRLARGLGGSGDGGRSSTIDRPITIARVTELPSELWAAPREHFQGQARAPTETALDLLFHPVAASVSGITAEESGRRYVDLLRAWNPARTPAVRTTGLRLELDITAEVRAALRDRRALLPLLVEGPMHFLERWHLSHAEPPHLRPMTVVAPGSPFAAEDAPPLDQPTSGEPCRLVIETRPGGVRVFARAESLGTSPKASAMELEVKPGPILLRFEKDGFEPKEVPLILKPGAIKPLVVTLEPRAAESPAEPIKPPARAARED